MDLIVLAIPVFFLLIGLELLVTRGRGYYNLGDTIADLGCGILQQLLAAFLRVALFAAYVVIYERARLVTLPADSAAVWFFGFLGVDCLYYWFHRTSHEVNAAWAAHVVHHQSEEYNLSVALRQGSFQQLFSWPFYLPLALLGLPPLVFLTLSAFNTLYQFWIHTRAIGRLGPLEWVFNTPSHHRVHHARNPKYIDRNHGGTLIVWDRLFGTFREEEEEPVYGVTRPLQSWNPLWANVHYWLELIGLARRTRRLRDRVRVFLARPGWRPDDLGGFVPPPEVDRTTHRPWSPGVPRWLARYALAQLVLLLALTTLFLHSFAELGALARAAGALAVVASVVALGGLLEGHRWAFGLEAGRLAIAGVALAAMLWPQTWVAALLGLTLSMAIALWLLLRAPSREPRTA